MTKQEFYDNLVKSDFFEDVDESCFSDELRLKTGEIKFEDDQLQIKWLTKYWDYDADEVIDCIEDTLIKYAEKLFVLTEELEVLIEVYPDDCSEWDEEEDECYASRTIILK